MNLFLNIRMRRRLLQLLSSIFPSFLGSILLFIGISTGNIWKLGAQSQNHRPILIINGTVHIGNGTLIKPAFIAMENGIITHVGSSSTIRLDVARYNLIDAKDKHIYPALILPSLSIGPCSKNETTQLFTEKNQPLRGHTSPPDKSTEQAFHPQLRAITDYDTTTPQLAALRSGGVFLAQLTPSCGLLSGSSSVVLLKPTQPTITYSVDEGIHLYWPTLGSSYATQVGAIRHFFEAAKTYAQQIHPDSTSPQAKSHEEPSQRQKETLPTCKSL